MAAKISRAASSKPGAAIGFDEQLRHLGSGVAIDRAIDADHSAERRHRIALQRPLVSLDQRGRYSCAAGIGVLDDGADNLVELLRQVPRRLQIDDIVVAELFALELLAIRYSLTRAVGIERGLLMRILAVAQIEGFSEAEPQSVGETVSATERKLPAVLFRRTNFLQRGRDRRVIRRRGGEGFLRQPPLRLQRERSVIALHLAGDCVVVRRRSDDGNILKILCRRAHHRRPANVDVLNDVFELRPRLGGGLLEGVEIDHHHVDGLDAVRADGGAMLRLAANVQNAAMHLGMKRLHPAIEHLGEAGEFGDIFHRDARLAQQFGGAAGRNQFHAHRRQAAREVHQPCFIGNA